MYLWVYVVKVIVGLHTPSDVSHLSSADPTAESCAGSSATTPALISSLFQIFTFYNMLSNELNHLSMSINVVLSQVAFSLWQYKSKIEC